MYGFYVHAGIDGGANFIVYALVALDKTSATLLRGYRSAVARYGRPLRVRADMALEALPIGADMLDHMGPGAYIAGPRTSNTVSASSVVRHRGSIKVISCGTAIALPILSDYSAYPLTALHELGGLMSVCACVEN